MAPPAKAANICDSIHDSNDIPAVCSRKFSELCTAVRWNKWILGLVLVGILGAGGLVWSVSGESGAAAAERSALREMVGRDRETNKQYFEAIATDVREIRNRLDK